MEYIIFTGFDISEYKESPTIRLKINNILIDEYEIKKSSKQIEFNISPFTTLTLDYLKIYKINITNKKNIIEIETLNDINNYTNGFLTKCALIKFKTFVMIPYKIVKNFSKFKERKFRYMLDSNYTKTISINNIRKHYKKRSLLFGGDISKEFVFRNKNNEIEKVLGDLDGECWVGKSGCFTLTTYKKHNCLVANYPTIGYHKVPRSDYIEAFVNKYTQYENQRDTNS